MNNPLKYTLENNVAHIQLDDGKANAMSIEMMAAITEALDQAERDRAMVVLSGREGVFSGGFHLAQLSSSPENTVKMLRAGADLSMRLLNFPFPTIAVCTGHAYPMGAFLLLSTDYRIGAEGDFRIGMNEVMIGISAPLVFVELARTKLVRSYFSRTEMTGEMFGPSDAMAAGFLDEIVPPSSLEDAVSSRVELFKKIDVKSHRSAKSRSRTPLIQRMKEAVELELNIDAVKRALAS